MTYTFAIPSTTEKEELFNLTNLLELPNGRYSVTVSPTTELLGLGKYVGPGPDFKVANLITDIEVKEGEKLAVMVYYDLTFDVTIIVERLQ